MATTERKGILKRPAPAPRAFFSFTRDMLSISRLLGPGGQPGGATPGVPDGERAVLKRAHFIVPEMRVVYPISSANAPSSAAQSEAKLEIDEAERLRREAEYHQAWTAARVEALYKDVCKLRDERVDPTIATQIRANPGAPQVLDLSRTKFTFDAASALADLLALDWGLQRLILTDCDLDDLSLKPILHALLIPDSLPYLALANNRRLRSSAFKMIASYLSRTYALEFIDLSLNVLDKRSVESILAVLPPAPPQPPPSALSTPRMSRMPSIASMDTPSPGVQFSNPFDSTGVRPSIDTNVAVPRRVKDPARYPESPGAGPSSPRGSQLGSPRGSFSNPTGPAQGQGLGSPRASVSSLTSVSETPQAGSPVDRERIGSGLGTVGNNWSGAGRGRGKRRTRRALVGIRLDECALRGPGLEALAHAIRTSQIQTVSLRANKIGQAGAVAVALMMKDYPDQTQSISGPSQSQFQPGAPGSTLAPPTTGLGLGLNLTPDSSSRSTPQGSPRPMSASLSAPGASTASTPISTTSTGPPDLGRPNLHSHSSLTTVSTFKEQDIARGPPSPPEVRIGLAPTGTGDDAGQGKAVEGDVKGTPTSVNGHPKVPPVVAPKPRGLQARLAGAVAAGTSGSNSQPESQPQSESPPSLTQSPVPLSPPHNRPLAPPPRHPAAQPAPPVPGTNYTAYVPRVRRAAGGATPVTTPAPKPPAPSTPAGGPIPVPYIPRQTPLAVRLQNAARAAAGTPPPTSSASVSRPGTGARATGVGANAVTMITSSSLGGVTTRLPSAPSTNTNSGLAMTGASGAGGMGTGASAGHLDLTSNSLDVAGVLALSVGLKVNYGIRCLDLSIVPGEEEMARLCREILKICLRNTERAQAAEEARAGKVAEGVATPILENGPTVGGAGSGVWDPIEHSALARVAQVNINATAGAGVDPAGRIGVWKMTPGEVMAAARACADEFAAGGAGGEELVRRAREIRAVLVEMIRTERDERALGEMLALNDALAPVLAGATPVIMAGVGAAKEGTREEGIRKEMGLGLSIGGEEERSQVAAVEAEAEEADGDEEGEGEEEDGPVSPTENLSRSWVAEEGEILRKGRVLLSPNQLESGTDSEALRQELLEAQ
ncbi:hypothetical protein FRC06_000537, partial [Ceratobasidium sp. 370]